MESAVRLPRRSLALPVLGELNTALMCLNLRHNLGIGKWQLGKFMASACKVSLLYSGIDGVNGKLSKSSCTQNPECKRDFQIITRKSDGHQEL